MQGGLDVTKGIPFLPSSRLVDLDWIAIVKSDREDDNPEENPIDLYDLFTLFSFYRIHSWIESNRPDIQVHNPDTYQKIILEYYETSTLKKRHQTKKRRFEDDIAFVKITFPDDTTKKGWDAINDPLAYLPEETLDSMSLEDYRILREKTDLLILANSPVQSNPSLQSTTQTQIEPMITNAEQDSLSQRLNMAMETQSISPDKIVATYDKTVIQNQVQEELISIKQKGASIEDTIDKMNVIGNGVLVADTTEPTTKVDYRILTEVTNVPLINEIVTTHPLIQIDQVQRVEDDTETEEEIMEEEPPNENNDQLIPLRTEPKLPSKMMNMTGMEGDVIVTIVPKDPISQNPRPEEIRSASDTQTQTEEAFMNAVIQSSEKLLSPSRAQSQISMIPEKEDQKNGEDPMEMDPEGNGEDEARIRGGNPEENTRQTMEVEEGEPIEEIRDWSSEDYAWYFQEVEKQRIQEEEEMKKREFSTEDAQKYSNWYEEQINEETKQMGTDQNAIAMAYLDVKNLDRRNEAMDIDPDREFEEEEEEEEEENEQNKKIQEELQDLGDDQKAFVNAVLNQEKREIYLSGEAGTGKTFVLKRLIRILENRGDEVLVVAPTSIAASLVKGSTIHSAFGLEPGKNPEVIASVVRRVLQRILQYRRMYWTIYEILHTYLVNTGKLISGSDMNLEVHDWDRRIVEIAGENLRERISTEEKKRESIGYEEKPPMPMIRNGKKTQKNQSDSKKDELVKSEVIPDISVLNEKDGEYLADLFSRHITRYAMVTFGKEEEGIRLLNRLSMTTDPRNMLYFVFEQIMLEDRIEQERLPTVADRYLMETLALLLGIGKNQSGDQRSTQYRLISDEMVRTGTRTGYPSLYDRLDTILARIQYLIVDEISMVSAFMFTTMEMLLRVSKLYHVRSSVQIGEYNIPFGGISVVVTGDLYQLPPVKAKYVFLSNAWKDFVMYELRQQWRQDTEDELFQILYAIRTNRVPALEWAVYHLRKYVLSPDELEKKHEEGTLLLVSTNREVKLHTDKMKEKLIEMSKTDPDFESKTLFPVSIALRTERNKIAVVNIKNKLEEIMYGTRVIVLRKIVVPVMSTETVEVKDEGPNEMQEWNPILNQKERHHKIIGKTKMTYNGMQGKYVGMALVSVEEGISNLEKVMERISRTVGYSENTVVIMMEFIRRINRELNYKRQAYYSRYRNRQILRKKRIIKDNRTNIEYLFWNGMKKKIEGKKENIVIPVVEVYNAEKDEKERIGIPYVIELDIKRSRSGFDLKKAVFRIPIFTAWAMTIHKAQGMTLNEVSITNEHLFAKGQAYVSLSRLVGIRGLLLKDIPLVGQLKIEPAAKEEMERLRSEESKRIEEEREKKFLEEVIAEVERINGEEKKEVRRREEELKRGKRNEPKPIGSRPKRPKFDTEKKAQFSIRKELEAREREEERRG